MGLDLKLRETSCETCGHEPEGFSINYTYNVAPMWYFFYPDDEGMVQIDGMTGDEALVKLLEFSKLMTKNKSEMIKLNPPNGWGSYDGFMEFINECMKACIDKPNAIWESWR